MNVCDNCFCELHRKRLVLGDAQDRVVWTLGFVDVDQEHRLVACSRECAQELTPEIRVPKRFESAPGGIG